MYIPNAPDEYVDEDGEPILEEGESIIIINQCILASMDLAGDETIECTHFEGIDDKENMG